MNSRIVQFCSALEEKLDTVLFRERKPDETSATPRTSDLATIGKEAAKNAGALVGGGAATVGAIAAHSAIMKRHGTRGLLSQGASGPLGAHNMAPRGTGGTATIRPLAAYKAAGTSVAQPIANRVQSGLRAGRHAAHVIAEDGQGTVKSILGGLRKGVRVAARR